MTIIIGVFFRMSSSDSKNSRKYFVWKYVIEVSEEQYLRCKFCNQRCAGGVNRLKHHLAVTHHGMKPYPKVSEDVRLECKEALTNFKDQKTKRNELLQGICQCLFAFQSNIFTNFGAWFHTMMSSS